MLNRQFQGSKRGDQIVKNCLTVAVLANAIKRLMVISKDLFLGMSDNPDYKADTLVLKGEEINDAIVGKVAWWWGKQR